MIPFGFLRTSVLLGSALVISGCIGQKVPASNPPAPPPQIAIAPAATDISAAPLPASGAGGIVTGNVIPDGPSPDGAAIPVVGMANPASVFCEQQGGTLEMLDQTGMCKLPDGRMIEEWAYFRAQNPG